MATYLHFILHRFSKTVKIRRHTSTGIYVDYTEGSLGGYLPIFYINWSVFLWQWFWPEKQRRHNWENSAAFTIFENSLNVKCSIGSVGIITSAPHHPLN